MSGSCSEKGNMIEFRVCFRIALLMSAVSCCLLAQGTGDIVGTVTDNSGGVLGSAKITSKNIATGLTRSTETNASGDYALTLLPVGNYSVTVEAVGFKTFTYPSIALTTGDRQR